jgi:hypothetical protein
LTTTAAGVNHRGHQVHPRLLVFYKRKKSSKVGIVLCKKPIRSSCPTHDSLSKLKESALLWLLLCFLATSIMGVEEAPTSPAAPSMGVEEVTTTPLEEIMVCVVGVEEPPPASAGVNIHVSAPGRAEYSDFSSLPRTNSVGKKSLSG